MLNVFIQGVSTGGPVDTATIQKRQEFAQRIGQKTDFGQAPKGYVAGMGTPARARAHTHGFGRYLPMVLALWVCNGQGVGAVEQQQRLHSRKRSFRNDIYLLGSISQFTRI